MKTEAMITLTVENETVRSETNAPPSHYLKSNEALELIGCFLFYLFSVNYYFYVFSVDRKVREIPYQYVESTADYVKDLDYDEKVAPETFSEFLLEILTVILPLFLQLFLSLKSTHQKLEKVHATLCVYLVAHGLTNLATTFVKNYVAYLRPVFYDGCRPDDTYQKCSSNASFYRQSFPSAHASCAFCGLTVFALFLHLNLGLGSIRTISLVSPTTNVRCAASPNNDDIEYRMNDWKVRYNYSPTFYRLGSYLSLLPMALALFIAATRVHENRHFPADVIGGALLGGSIAIFVNGIWFDDGFIIYETYTAEENDHKGGQSTDETNADLSSP